MSNYQVNQLRQNCFTVAFLILFSKNSQVLNTWIEETKLLNLSDINSFINGIENDIDGFIKST
ncbi:hypothetical protein [Clostridium tunisiense]|uniref:hypothetical protein n=1 Tax=Clostridium tunisiense TaxID=219748 RepID=UPI00178C4798|nr:hypothetical protein [Clostridium tunisiense]